MARVVTGRRILLLLFVVVVAALAVVAFRPAPIDVDLAQVVRGPLRIVVRHEGKTRVRDRFLVTAPVAGRVQRIVLRPGDAVRSGETVLARIDPAVPVPLDERSSKQAHAAVAAAKAAIEQARAELARLEQRRRLARLELERSRRLFEEGVLSRSLLDQRETEAAAADEAVGAAAARAEQAGHDLESARARLLPPLQTSGSGQRIELLAPIDGVVLRRIQESESSVVQGTPLIEIADTSRLEVVADFLSTDAVGFEPGQRAVIDGWGGGRDLAATVRRVEPQAFMKISALGVEEQRVNVLLDFADPREAWSLLGDGYRVQAGVVTWESPDVLQVPASALFRDGEDWALFRYVEGRARLTAVDIGHRGEAMVEVVAGLQPGETVILHPADAVTDGGRVRKREI